MHRLIAVLIVVISIAGCKRSDQTESQLSWPQVLWQVNLGSWVDYPLAVSASVDGGFIVLQGGPGTPVSGPYTYLRRFNANHELVDSVQMYFPPANVLRYNLPTFVYDKTDDGGIWVAYQKDGLNIEHFDHELSLVHSIRDTSYEFGIATMSVASNEVRLVGSVRLSDDSIVSKFYRLNMSGKELSSVPLSSKGAAERRASSRIKITHIETASSENSFLAGTLEFRDRRCTHDSSYVFAAFVDSLGNLIWSKTCFGHQQTSVSGATVLQNGSLLISAGSVDFAKTRDADSSQVVFMTFSLDGNVTIQNDIRSKANGNAIVSFVEHANRIIGFGNQRSNSVSIDAPRPLFMLTLSDEGVPLTRAMTGYALGVTDVAVTADGEFLVVGLDHSKSSLLAGGATVALVRQ